MKIGCVILAGGKSSRMGTDKALLELDGKTFIEQISKELEWFEEKIIAHGNTRELSDTNWTVVSDIYLNHGPLGGIHSALSVCQSDALFVVTCDMPLLKSSLAHKLCDIMCESEVMSQTVDNTVLGQVGYDAVISVGEDGKMHPLCGVYRKSALPILEEQLLSGRNKVMEALKKLHVKYITVDSSMDTQQLFNINTPQDYEKLNLKKKR